MGWPWGLSTGMYTKERGRVTKMEKYKVELTEKEVKSLGEGRYIHEQGWKRLFPLIILIVGIIGIDSLVYNLTDNTCLGIASVSPLIVGIIIYGTVIFRRSTRAGQEFLKETQRQATD
jgi:hypothetical protein